MKPNTFTPFRFAIICLLGFMSLCIAICIGIFPLDIENEHRSVDNPKNVGGHDVITNSTFKQSNQENQSFSQAFRNNLVRLEQSNLIKNREYWIKNGLGLKPDAAASYLQSIKDEVTDMNLRAYLGRFVINDLVVRGFEEEAWNLIDPTYGSVRNAQVSAFFEGLPNCNEQTRYLNKIENSDEKVLALQGILQKLGVSKLGDLSKLPFSWSSDEKNMVAMHLAGGFDIPTSLKNDAAVALQTKQGAASLVELSNAGIFSDKEISLVMETNNYLTPDQLLEILDSLQTDSQPTLKSSYSNVIRKITTKDSSRVIDIVSKRNDMPFLVGAAVSEYLSYDSVGASRWFSNASTKLNPNQYDAGAIVFVGNAIGAGEFDTARSWTQTLKSNDLRDSTFKRIGSK